MAKVSGLKEKLHMPLYDAFYVAKEDTFKGRMKDPRVIRFFVDVQNKTRLDTNLQASGVLPSMNSYEAHALRVVASNFKDTTIEVANEEITFTGDDLLTKLIYNSVTTLLVGEKIMIEVPTFWFPAGAGVNSPGTTYSHGQPDPMATFRFAEPVFIEPQQNFRVEISFPSDLPEELKEVSGPLRIWVVLDGYLTRDVQ